MAGCLHTFYKIHFVLLNFGKFTVSIDIRIKWRKRPSPISSSLALVHEKQNGLNTSVNNEWKKTHSNMTRKICGKFLKKPLPHSTPFRTWTLFFFKASQRSNRVSKQHTQRYRGARIFHANSAANRSIKEHAVSLALVVDPFFPSLFSSPHPPSLPSLLCPTLPPPLAPMFLHTTPPRESFLIPSGVCMVGSSTAWYAC